MLNPDVCTCCLCVRVRAHACAGVRVYLPAYACTCTCRVLVFSFLHSRMSIKCALFAHCACTNVRTRVYVRECMFDMQIFLFFRATRSSSLVRTASLRSTGNGLAACSGVSNVDSRYILYKDGWHQFLKIDYRVDCLSDEYQLYKIVAYVAVLVWPSAI